MKTLSRLSDAALFASIEKLARDERRNLPRILARLAELDKRHASAKKGASLFDYCLKTLRWSEGETARRIHVARAADRFQEIYSHLWNGRLTLTTAAILAPRLTPENHSSLIRAALRLSQREVEALVARVSPTAERAERIRPLGPRPSAPQNPAGGLFDSPPSSGPPSLASMLPTAAESPDSAPPQPAPPLRVEFTFTADDALAREVEDARSLLRNKYPFCRLEDLFREAVRALLERLDPGRRPSPKARPGARKGWSRRVPPAVRAYVWKRDKGRCAYVAPDGTRCTARAFLELDHVRPWSLGGPSDDPRNLRLLCHNHNMDSARRVFGFI